MQSDKSVIPALTGIRALCVYFIFFKHNNPFTESGNPGLFLFVHQFYSFLSFFFVLSGFLICHRYYPVGTFKKRELYNYFINRVTRVFPILIILISFTFLLLYLERSQPVGEIIKTWFYNITLLKGFSSEYYLTGIGPSWSMSVEELFYLISPLLFLLIKKPSGLIKFVGLMYGIGLLLTLIFSNLEADGFFSNYLFTFYTTFFGRAFEFACGIFLAMIVKQKFSSSLISKISWPVAAGSAIVIIVLCVQFILAQRAGVENAVETWPGVIINNILLPIGITIIFYGLVYKQSLLKDFLGSRLMVALGNSTYSFYLLHTSFLMSWVTKYISNNLLVAFIAMIILSYLFYKMIEQPLATGLRKRWSKK